MPPKASGNEKSLDPPPAAGLLHYGPPPLSRTAVILATYLVAFIVLDLLARQFEGLRGIIAWYPPAGLTYALLLVFGARFTPAVTIALLISSIFIYHMPQPVFLLLLWALVISLIYGGGAAFLRDRLRFDWRLQKLRDVTWLVVTTLFVSAVLALLSVSSSALSSNMPRTEVPGAIILWWIGETVGVLTVAPFLLVHVMPRLKRFAEGQTADLPARPSFPRPTLSVMGQAFSIALVFYWVFGGSGLNEFRPVYLISLPLIWIALDHGFKGVTAGIVVSNFGVTLAMWLLRFDLAHIGELQLLMIVNCLVGLLMGAVVSERKRAEDGLRQSEERFSKVFHASPVAISVTTLAEARFVELNDSFLKLLGQPSRDQVIGRSVLQLNAGISPEYRASMAQALRAHGRLSNVEAQFDTLAGEKRDVLASLEPIELNGQACILTMAHDITERNQGQARIRRQFGHLSALSTIERVIMSSFDLGMSLAEILAQATIELGIDAADVLLLNSDSKMLECRAERGFHTEASPKAHIRLGESLAGRVALERHVVQISNLTDEVNASVLTTRFTAEGFVSYYGVPLVAKGQVKGVLEVFHRTALEPDAEWLDFLNALAGQAAVAIDNAILFENLGRSNSELTVAYDATIEGWSHSLDLRGKETEGHSQRLAQMTCELARAFGLSEAEVAQVRWGALLHDIGQMRVPDAILHKPGPLTDEEWVAMKQHPTFAYEMLAPIHYLRQALDIPYCHHEKWDGTGYPRGLKGEQIPLTARIFSVVDAWDALNSDRPYRRAWSAAKAREVILSESGKHFDPGVVEALMGILAAEGGYAVAPAGH